MMDYLLYPNNMLKTIQKAELDLKHCKISESKNQLENLFAAYCLFLNVNFEALGVSKILFNFLSVVFEYCGMLKNPKNLEKNSKIFEKNEKITNSEKKINKLNNFEKKEIKIMNSEKKELVVSKVNFRIHLWFYEKQKKLWVWRKFTNKNLWVRWWKIF